MTVSVVVPALKIEIDTEIVQRTLAVARRALRAREAAVVVDPAETPRGPGFLSAGIAPFAVDAASLVVQDEDSRVWSSEDEALLRDIAATFAATLRLSEDLKRHRAVVDNVPGLVFERRKTATADALYTFLGSCRAALPVVRDLIERGSVEDDWRFVHSDDRSMLRDALRASIAEERDLDVSFRVEDPEGRVHWVRSQAAVRREEDGTAVWSGLCLDITDVMAGRIAASPTGDPAVAAPSAVDPAAAASRLPDAPVAARVETLAIEPDALTDEGSGFSRPHILLADDLDLNRKLISDMLSLDGYSVDSVADGAAAVEAVKEKTYDLVLMDMIMPGMDGMEATRAIRALPAPICDVPIVALTAHSFREQLDNCLHAGMNATLTKPMSFEALSTAVSLWARSRPRAA